MYLLTHPLVLNNIYDSTKDPPKLISSSYLYNEWFSSWMLASNQTEFHI